MMKYLLSLVMMMSFGSAAVYGGDSDASKLFDAKCAKCHGTDGKGTDKMAKVLKVEKAKLNLTGGTTVKASDADLVKVTTDGRKKMPKFKGKVTDSEIASLVKYIRTLASSKK